MTLDEVIARTAASLDQHLERAIEHDELLLSDKGATEDEIVAHVAIRREQGVKWKAECLAEIRRGLTEPDAPSARLQ